MLFKYISDNNLPTVITLHDAGLYGKVLFYTEANCFRWQEECIGAPIKDNPSWFIDPLEETC